MGASLARWWDGLAPRERRLVTGGLVVVLAVLVWLLLWEPPAQGIRKLQADLPQLRSQDAAMRAMAAEATTLRSASGATAAIAPAERVAAVRRSLERAGLWREGAPEVAARGGDAGGVSTVSTLSVGGTVTTVTSNSTVRSEPPVVTAEPSDRVRVRFDNIDYGVWVAWLASAEGELTTRATRASIVALAPKAPVGHVRAEVVLDWTPTGTPSSAPRS